MRLMMKTLNDYLREKRVESGLSQLEVARVLGYASPQFVSNWERGLVSPPLETIGTLIGLYKISQEEVIDRILEETRGYLESQLGSKGGSKARKAQTASAGRAAAKPGSRGQKNSQKVQKKSAQKASSKSPRRESLHA